MPLKINSNQAVSQAQNALQNNRLTLNKSFERLSSGLKINRAGDNPAGLAIALKLLTQSEGFSQAIGNAQDAVNLSRTAEGGLSQSSAILQRLRDLAIQSANGTLTQSDRENIQVEATQLQEELDQVAQTTEFNQRRLLDGSIAAPTPNESATVVVAQNTRVGATEDLIDSIASASTTTTEDLAFQIEVTASNTPNQFNLSLSSSAEGLVGTFSVGGGPPLTQIDLTFSGNTVATLNVNTTNITNADIGNTALVQITQATQGNPNDSSLTFQTGPNEGQTLNLGIDAFNTQSLNLESTTLLGGTDADSFLKAQNAIGTLDKALDKVNTSQAKIGAFQNRLESTLSRLAVSRENTLASAATIRDTDFAEETSTLTRAQILNQTNTAALSQANVSSQSILDLLS